MPVAGHRYTVKCCIAHVGDYRMAIVFSNPAAEGKSCDRAPRNCDFAPWGFIDSRSLGPSRYPFCDTLTACGALRDFRLLEASCAAP
jgi:hypothetical protein